MLSHKVQSEMTLPMRLKFCKNCELLETSFWKLCSIHGYVAASIDQLYYITVLLVTFPIVTHDIIYHFLIKQRRSVYHGRLHLANTSSSLVNSSVVSNDAAQLVICFKIFLKDERGINVYSVFVKFFGFSIMFWIIYMDTKVSYQYILL